MQDRMSKHNNKLPPVTESRNVRSIGHHNFQPEVLDLFLIKRQVSTYVSKDLMLKSYFP